MDVLTTNQTHFDLADEAHAWSMKLPVGELHAGGKMALGPRQLQFCARESSGSGARAKLLFGGYASSRQRPLGASSAGGTDAKGQSATCGLAITPTLTRSRRGMFCMFEELVETVKKTPEKESPDNLWGSSWVHGRWWTRGQKCARRGFSPNARHIEGWLGKS